jgi:HCOMODA/2-hydroxy-3-carboxy-muconic semialdehyde decarboxylase
MIALRRASLVAFSFAFTSLTAFAQGQPAQQQGGSQQQDPASDDAIARLIDDLVTANHILVDQGVLDGYGHVSVRSPRDPTHFYMARSVAPELVTSKDILEYDLSGEPVSAKGVSLYVERFMHSEIYRARPDVMAVAHNHAPGLIPFGVTGIELKPLYHMSAFLTGGVPIFDIKAAGGETDMLVRNPTLGKALAKTLGSRPVALLRGHGAVVVATDLPRVVFRSVYTEQNAKLQAQAMQLGGKQVKFLDPEEAKKAEASIGGGPSAGRGSCGTEGARGAEVTYRILAIDGGGARRLRRAAARPAAAGDPVSRSRGSGGRHLDRRHHRSRARRRSRSAELAQLYLDHSREIFDSSLLRKVATVEGMLAARYDNTALRKVALGVFGDRKLDDLGKRVLVPTFDLDNGDGPEPLPGGALRTWKPKFFHNFPGGDSDGQEKAVDVALRTSAAPVFLPSYQGYIDGGVVANNPSMAAVSLALHPAGAGKSIDDLRVFSLSTGTNSQYLPGDHAWGAANWGIPLIELMIGGTSGVADYECTVILGPSRYFRLDPVLEANVALDDARRVNDLYQWASRCRSRRRPRGCTTSSSRRRGARGTSRDPVLLLHRVTRAGYRFLDRPPVRGGVVVGHRHFPRALVGRALFDALHRAQRLLGLVGVSRAVPAVDLERLGLLRRSPGGGEPQEEQGGADGPFHVAPPGVLLIRWTGKRYRG